MKHIEKVFDLTTNEEIIIERDYTPEELAIIEEVRIRAEAEQSELSAKAAAKVALLAQLGITEEQAKLLLS